MNVEKVKNYINKKVVIVLNNNFRYTTIIPEFKGSSFQITDKFNSKIEIECDFIGTIIELNEEVKR